MKPKVLLVTYLPAGSFSRTRKLVEAFQEAAAPFVQIDTEDLTHHLPDVFLPAQMTAYVTRNFQGKPLNPELAKAIAGMDAATDRFMAANHVAVAFPMHNFSLPAVVKAYFDSVLLKGRTWDMNAGGYVGLMKGKSALILNSSGGEYEQGPMQSWEHCVSCAKNLFKFMGFSPVEAVTAQGLNMHPDQVDAILARAREQVARTVQKLYGGR